ncbi:hypothetical protein J437_LFUL017271 [Ladona fulva]|uniref:Rab3GAP regulatory subunit C-terminal domain-containing protein n=1 Tax=Ladona fulva TaxID=123851 RepID=A0A8K0PA08_LADFU|nr:hypothetical protein J437_LFUL017271 [Ladona fulva]
MMGLIYRGAEMFGLPMDQIRRYHVCELYSCGYDREAEELMSAVVDKENLSSQLLVIVFQRLKYYLDQSGQGDHRSEVMATFSPAALARFSSQSTYLVSKDMTMKCTEQLLGIILAHLDEESKLYSEALGILDAVRVLASHE